MENRTAAEDRRAPSCERLDCTKSNSGLSRKLGISEDAPAEDRAAIRALAAPHRARSQLCRWKRDRVRGPSVSQEGRPQLVANPPPSRRAGPSRGRARDFRCDRLSDFRLGELRSLTNGLPSRTNVCTRRKRTCGPQGGRPGLTRNGHWVRVKGSPPFTEPSGFAGLLS